MNKAPFIDAAELEKRLAENKAKRRAKLVKHLREINPNPKKVRTPRKACKYCPVKPTKGATVCYECGRKGLK